VYNTARQTKLLLNVLQRNIQNDEEKSTLQNVLSELTKFTLHDLSKRQVITDKRDLKSVHSAQDCHVLQNRENCHLTISDEMTQLYLSARVTGATGLTAA